MGQYGSLGEVAARCSMLGLGTTSNTGAGNRGTQIDPAVPGIISSSGTAAGNIFTGIADVFRASHGEGGGSSEPEGSGADAFIDPGAGSSFFESTGGKVVVIGGIALALLATALIVIPKKKSAAAVANRRRNRRRNGVDEDNKARSKQEVAAFKAGDFPKYDAYLSLDGSRLTTWMDDTLAYVTRKKVASTASFGGRAQRTYGNAEDIAGRWWAFTSPGNGMFARMKRMKQPAR